MKTVSGIAIVILLLTTLASSGDEAPRTVAVLEFDLRGDIPRDEPDLGTALGGTIEAVISEGHRIASRGQIARALSQGSRNAVEMFGDPAVAAGLGADVGAHLVVMGRLTPIGGDYLVELRVADVVKGEWAGLRVKQCSDIEEVPRTLELMLTQMGLAGSRDAPQRRDQLEAENAALREKLLATQMKLKKLQDLLTTGSKPAPESEVPVIHGTVKALNQDLNIVILSVGADDGVKVGYKFTIYRDDEYVATVVVDKVEKDHSSGYSIKEVEQSPIQAGDQATTRF